MSVTSHALRQSTSLSGGMVPSWEGIMRVKQPDVIGGSRAVRHDVVPGSGRGCGPGTAEALDKNDRDREQQAAGREREG